MVVSCVQVKKLVNATVLAVGVLVLQSTASAQVLSSGQALQAPPTLLASAHYDAGDELAAHHDGPTVHGSSHIGRPQVQFVQARR